MNKKISSFLIISFLFLLLFLSFSFFKEERVAYEEREVKDYHRHQEEKKDDDVEESSKIDFFYCCLKIFGGGLLVVTLFGLLLILISYWISKKDPDRNSWSDNFFYFGSKLSFLFSFLVSFFNFPPFCYYNDFLKKRSENVFDV